MESAIRQARFGRDAAEKLTKLAPAIAGHGRYRPLRVTLEALRKLLDNLHCVIGKDRKLALGRQMQVRLVRLEVLLEQGR